MQISNSTWRSTHRTHFKKLSFRITIVSLLSLPVVSAAGPTGLFVMPIADILRHREASFAGLSQVDGSAVSNGVSASVGAVDRFEFGFDQDLSAGTTYNAKLLLAEGPWGAVSIGGANLTRDACDPYVVGRIDLSSLRVHAGLWRLESRNRFMAGCDFAVSPDLVGSVEYLDGRDSEAWGMMTMTTDGFPGWALQGSVRIPLHREGLGFGIGLSYAFKF